MISPSSQPFFVHLCLVIDNGSTASFSCADFDSGGQFGYEDFTIPHMTSVAGVADGLNQFFQRCFVNDNFYFNFRKQVHREYISSIDFFLSMGEAAAIDFSNSNTGNADFIQFILQLFQLFRTDNGIYLVDFFYLYS